MQGVVYLLHLAHPLGNLDNPRAQAQHYLGWALNLSARLADHRAGRGAALTRAAVERGITFEVVRVWPGDRLFERALKRRKMGPRLCPVCGLTHPRGCAPAVAAHQLAFDLADDLADEWPDPPVRRGPDWYELTYFSRPVPVYLPRGDEEGVDIPF